MRVPLPRERPRLRAIGIFNRADFIRCKSDRIGFAVPDHFEDWLDEREGLQVGLSSAGVRAALIMVDLDMFLAWCREGSMPLDQRALDEFAATQIRHSKQEQNAMPRCQRSLFQKDLRSASRLH